MQDGRAQVIGVFLGILGGIIISQILFNLVEVSPNLELLITLGLIIVISIPGIGFAHFLAKQPRRTAPPQTIPGQQTTNIPQQQPPQQPVQQQQIPQQQYPQQPPQTQQPQQQQ